LGSYGRGEGEMRFPEGIAVDQQGNVYVADTENNRISAIFF
jgi:DNA-binding beta-propeller fold protein YncE